MIRDRGNKKWTAMMLPEHLTLIRDWYESDNDVPKPHYDEFEMNILADDLNIAYQTKSTVRVIYWVNKRVEVYEGQIMELIPSEQIIKIITESNEIKLKLKYIIKLDTYE